MRFHQLTESAKVTAQDVYDAAVLLWGKKNLAKYGYIVQSKVMPKVKAMFPGLRVLPKELRDAQTGSYYDFSKAGVNLDAPSMPENPYDGDHTKFREFANFAAPLIAEFTKGKRSLRSPAPVAVSSEVSKVEKASAPADNKKPQKAEPPKELTKKEVIDLIAPMVRSAFVGRGVDFQYDGEHMGVRYWGNWEVPEGEEDDGDYDWEVPTSDTMTKARKIVADLNGKIPEGWKLDIQVGEKNWLDFEVLKK